MLDKHTTLLHHLFQLAVAQRISRVPTDAHQKDVDWESHPFGSPHRVLNLLCHGAQYRPAGGLTVNATFLSQAGRRLVDEGSAWAPSTRSVGVFHQEGVLIAFPSSD